MLKVIKVNSPIDLTRHDCAFVEQVIDLAEKAPNWNPENSISSLLAKIPIFLLNREKFDISFEGRSIKDPTDSETQPPEYLGIYTRLKDKYFNNIPSIFICPEKFFPIKNRSFQEMLADLLIHEFAHAKMDTSNGLIDPGIPLDSYSSVEEPFANWFVLKYFYWYSNGHMFHSVKDSIKQEPQNYSKGWDFFSASISDDCWIKWRNLKSMPIEIAVINDYMKAIINNNCDIKHCLYPLLDINVIEPKNPDSSNHTNLNTFRFERGLGPKKAMGIGEAAWLKEMGITPNNIKLEDGALVINGDVDLRDKKLDEIPIFHDKFNVKGNFWIDGNNLTSLKGCPKEVGGSFSCTNNKLASLNLGPESIGENFWCDDNELTSLEGCPKHTGGSFSCTNNQLASLKHKPKVSGNFWF